MMMIFSVLFQHQFQWLSRSSTGGAGRSGTVGGRVLPKRTIPKLDQREKAVIQQKLLGTDML